MFCLNITYHLMLLHLCCKHQHQHHLRASVWEISNGGRQWPIDKMSLTITYSVSLLHQSAQKSCRDKGV